MKKLTSVKILLIIWLRFINVTKSATVKVTDATELVIDEVKAVPTRFISHLDNFAGRQLQKNLLLKGIVVILYKLQRRRTKYGTYFIMPIVNPNEVITACINADATKASRFSTGTNIYEKSLLTTWLTIPGTLSGPLVAMLLALSNATTQAEIDAAWFILNPQLKKVMNFVQEGMDADRVNSIVICNFYGFHVRGKGGKSEQHFEGFTGTVTGSADFLAPVGPRGCCYQWNLWNAGRTIPVIIKTSTWAHATIANQPSKTSILISVDAVIGETVVEEGVIMEVMTK